MQCYNKKCETLFPGRGKQDLILLHRKMCNMHKTCLFLKRLFNVRLTHGKRVNQVTHV